MALLLIPPDDTGISLDTAGRTTRSVKFISVLTVILVTLLGLASFTLSFEALWHFARESGALSQERAWLFPLVVDGSILVFSISALRSSIVGDDTRSWTVDALAREAALSRSTFFERFSRAVGLPPMEYLLVWRMALAKDLLSRTGLAIAEVAERVGYGSASTFSTAFSRHVGLPPGRYARQQQ